MKVNFRKDISLISFFLFFISLFSFIQYIPSGLHLPYADAISRLNIARKVVDNLNPGLAQLGSVWLPLPQVLMLPFVWNDFLWRTGLAGTIMSTLSFILGGIFVYKSAKIISQSSLASFFSLCVYALNINMWYLQTTAMSECLFVALLAACVYFLLKWIKTAHWFHLVPAGISISGLTLTRYEGLPVLLGAILMVLFYSFIKLRKLEKVEGQILLFSFIACFGFFLWTLYLQLIFGDPLFWMKYYAAPHVEQVGDVVVSKYSQAKPFFAAVWQYFTSVSWMTGIFAIGISLISIPLMIIHSIRHKNWYFLPMFLPLSIFFMMTLSLQRNTPIVQPSLSLANILRSDTSMDVGFNIRYGLMIHSWLAILTVYLFSLPKLNILVFVFFLIQVMSYFSPRYTFIYKIPMRIGIKPYGELVRWMRDNYRGGPILISASGFEDQMFEMGFPYRYYIHEGTNKYWKEALDHPARYASYVVVDFHHPADSLGKELRGKPYWNWFYNLVYDSDKGKIYEIKSKPDIEIPNIPKFTPRPKEPSPFISKEGEQFIQQGKPFAFVGTNITKDIIYREEREIIDLLDELKTSGVTVARVWGYGEGNKDGFMPDSYKYNDQAFRRLGFVIAEAKKRNIYLIISLGNYQNKYGGISQYLQWDGLPSEKPEHKDMFFSHQFTRNRYREYISRVVTYKNPFTELELRDDPTIFAWELLYRPKISSQDKESILNEWFNEMRSVISHFDRNHIILTGKENIEEQYNFIL